MSEESIKRSTKKHRKSEREGKRSKTKKDRKSDTAEDNHDLCEGHQRSDSPIAKLELINDSTLTRTAEDQLSRTPPDTSSNTLSRTKVSRKRKRTDRDAIPDESVKLETELEPKKHKKRNEPREEDRMHGPPYTDPTVDESLSEQSRRALSYAYERCREIEVWKFNKARQNWLLRNVWSEQAVPESYMPLVIKYLIAIRGGAREKLIGECNSKVSEEASMQGAGCAQPSDHGTTAGSMINQQPSTSRALSILNALLKSS